VTSPIQLTIHKVLANWLGVGNVGLESIWNFKRIKATTAKGIVVSTHATQRIMVCLHHTTAQVS